MLIFPGKHILLFFGRFFLLFVLLMAPWPSLREAYASLYRGVGNALFTRIGEDGRVQFRPSTADDPDHDLAVTLTNQRTGSEYVFAGSSKQGYNPTSFLVALILATPIPWRRRLRALLWGLLLINICVALRALLFLVFAFSGDTALAIFTPGLVGTGILKYLHWVAVESLAGYLILPLPIWLAVCFRRSDWKSLIYTVDMSPVPYANIAGPTTDGDRSQHGQ